MFEYGTVARIQSSTGRYTGNIAPVRFMQRAVDANATQVTENIIKGVDGILRDLAKKNKLIYKYKKDFFEQIDENAKTGDKEWLMANIDIEAYRKEAAAILERQIKNIERNNYPGTPEEVEDQRRKYINTKIKKKKCQSNLLNLFSIIQWFRSFKRFLFAHLDLIVVRVPLGPCFKFDFGAGWVLWD
jgi:hypothetical protein